MKQWLSFRPRELRLALIAAGLIGCWVLVSAVVQPLWDRDQDLRLKVTTQTERLHALAHLVSQMPAIEQEYQEIAPYLQADDEEARGSFLNQLEALSREAHLRLNLKPRAGKQEERLSRFEVELDVEGSQENVMAFLDTILAMPTLITIERLRLASVPTKEQLLRANLVIHKLGLQQKPSSS